MIKRLIFDVDGTLITGVSFVEAIKPTLKKMNIYSKENEENFLEGIKTYEKNFNNYNINDYIIHMSQAINYELPKMFLNYFFDELKKIIPSDNEKIIKTIKELSNRYELVLLTNYFSESQMNRLNNMGIGHFFSECHGEKIIKPNRESYLNACGEHDPDECVMIGDDIILDIEKAQKIGLNTIFVNTKNSIHSNIKSFEVKNIEKIDIQLIKSIEENKNKYSIELK